MAISQLDPAASGPQILSEDETSYKIRTADGQEAMLSKSNPFAQHFVKSIQEKNARAQQAQASADQLMTQPQPGQPSPGFETDAPTPVPPTPAPAPIQPAMPPMAMQTGTQVKNESETVAYDPKAMEGVRKAVGEVNAATTAQMQAEQGKASATLPIVQQYESQLAERQRIEQEREEARQESVRQQMEALNTKQKELASMSIDASGFGRADTADRIVSGIAVVLGGFAAGVAGSDKNLALEMVQKAIDRDIMAQKANIENKNAEVTSARGNLKAFMEMAGDERAAELAERSRMLEQFKSKLEVVAATAANPQIAANAKATIAATNLKLAEAELEKTKRLDKRSTEAATKIEPTSMKPMDMVSDPVAKEHSDLQNAIQGLDEIEKLAGVDAEGKYPESVKGKLGPIDGRLNQLARAFGVDNADETELRTRIVQALADKIKAISGAQAAQAEFKRLEETLPKMTDNPETFFKVLRAERQALERRFLNVEKSWTGKRQLPNRFVRTLDEEVQQAKQKHGFNPGK